MSLASASDARWVATGAFDRVSPRRLPHYLGQARRLLAPPTWLAIVADLNRQIQPASIRQRAR